MILLQQFKNLMGWNRGNFDFKILTYHGVVSNFQEKKLERNFHSENQFIEHLKIIKKNKTKVFSLSEAIHERKNAYLPKNALCITFDDGYYNNLKALEILNDFNYPATVFISTAYINSSISIWTVNLSLLILKGNLQKLPFRGQIFNLDTSENRLSAFTLIRNHLKQLNGEERKKSFQEILDQFPPFEIENLLIQFPQFRMLTWKEIESNQSQDFSFQSHGHFHEIHHENQNLPTITEEIILSKAIIEKELKIPCEHFCFPNGNFNQKSLEVLHSNQYLAGYCLNESKVNLEDDAMAISRITPNTKPEKFKIQLLS